MLLQDLEQKSNTPHVIITQIQISNEHLTDRKPRIDPGVKHVTLQLQIDSPHHSFTGSRTYCPPDTVLYNLIWLTTDAINSEFLLTSNQRSKVF